mmetsp:Transcript_9818/g.22526  ORF Transcript_9818/g.22526 Transcript_9818/m.22526 type:complete len:229 (+) Transcript_9818:160-846(+)
MMDLRSCSRRRRCCSSSPSNSGRSWLISSSFSSSSDSFPFSSRACSSLSFLICWQYARRFSSVASRSCIVLSSAWMRADTPDVVTTASCISLPKWGSEFCQLRNRRLCDSISRNAFLVKGERDPNRQLRWTTVAALCSFFFSHRCALRKCMVLYSFAVKLKVRYTAEVRIPETTAPTIIATTAAMRPTCVMVVASPYPTDVIVTTTNQQQFQKYTGRSVCTGPSDTRT